MMVIASNRAEELKAAVPGLVVVDPRFELYSALTASARMGRIDLHMRSSGHAALKLADRIHVDAWLIASELDDMSGEDFVKLLQSRRGDARIAMISEGPAGSRQFALAEQVGLGAGVDGVVCTPVTVADLEALLDLPVEERRRRLPAPASPGLSWAAVPVTVGATMIAVAVLMIG